MTAPAKARDQRGIVHFAKRIRRCSRCNGRLTCLRCAGSTGGRSTSAAKRKAMLYALAHRYRWRPGDAVQPRLRKRRSWRGEVVRVGPGRRGFREVTVRVTRKDDAPANFVAVIAESLLAKVRP